MFARYPFTFHLSVCIFSPFLIKQWSSPCASENDKAPGFCFHVKIRHKIGNFPKIILSYSSPGQFVSFFQVILGLMMFYVKIYLCSYALFLAVLLFSCFLLGCFSYLNLCTKTYFQLLHIEQ